MKKITTLIVLAFVIQTQVSLGQVMDIQQNSRLGPDKPTFSGIDKFDCKTMGCPNHPQLNKTANNSSFDAKQKLDSLITKLFYVGINTWTPTNKYDYSYDENGNASVEIQNEWDTDLNIWVPQNKTERLFNEFNKPYEELWIYWEIDSNQWLPSRKYEYGYDENGSLIMEKSMEMDINTNQWVNNWKREYAYDIDFGIQSEFYSIWVIDSNMFIPSYIYEYTYDTIGNLVTHTKKMWAYNTMTWKYQYKCFYTYNNDNQDSTIVSIKLDYATDSLINWSRMEYYYDSNGFDKTSVLYYWKKNLNQWEFDNKHESNYDNDGKRTLLIRSLWNNNSNYWYHINKTEFTFDDNGNLSLRQYYNPTDSINWHILSEYEYNYDLEYTISEIFFPTHEWDPPEYCDYMFNKPTDFSIYRVNDGELFEEYKMTYYYSELNIGVPESQGKNIEVYPNPTSGQLMIINENDVVLKGINIYNQFGQIVFHKNIVPNIIDLSSLGQGIYIIEFVAENSLISKKLIIKG